MSDPAASDRPGRVLTCEEAIEHARQTMMEHEARRGECRERDARESACSQCEDLQAENAALRQQLKQQGDRLAAAEVLLKHARTWAAYNSNKSADAWCKISINCGNLLDKINRWLPAETAESKGGE